MNVFIYPCWLQSLQKLRRQKFLHSVGWWSKWSLCGGGKQPGKTTTGQQYDLRWRVQILNKRWGRTTDTDILRPSQSTQVTQVFFTFETNCIACRFMYSSPVRIFGLIPQISSASITIYPWYRTLPPKIEALKEKGIPSNSILVTMDVSSLYTNIDHEEGANACYEKLEERKINQFLLRSWNLSSY